MKGWKYAGYQEEFLQVQTVTSLIMEFDDLFMRLGGELDV